MEEKGFQSLMKINVLNLDTQFPQQHILLNWFKKIKHVAGKKMLKDRLKDAVSLRITTDIWTSCVNFSSRTLHYREVGDGILCIRDMFFILEAHCY